MANESIPHHTLESEGPVVVEKTNGKKAKAEDVVKTIDLELHGKESLDTITVVKRNGMLVPFRRDRIMMAIESAWRATKGIDQTVALSQEDYLAVRKVTENVVNEINRSA